MSKKNNKNEDTYILTPAGRVYIIRSLIESEKINEAIEYCKITEEWMAKHIIYKTHKKKK